MLISYQSAPAILTGFLVKIENGCGIGFLNDPVVIQDIATTVGAAAVTSSFSTTTADCGPGTFTIINSFAWLTLTSGLIKVEPITS